MGYALSALRHPNQDGYTSANVPWQRVVNRHGGMAAGYPGGRLAHQAELEAEGMTFNDRGEVDVKELLWWPQ